MRVRINRLLDHRAAFIGMCCVIGLVVGIAIGWWIG